MINRPVLFIVLLLAVSDNAWAFSPAYELSLVSLRAHRHSSNIAFDTSLYLSSEPPPSEDSDSAGGGGGSTDNDAAALYSDTPPQVRSGQSPDAPSSGALVEIPIDGSLVVLLPAAVIAIVGIATSILVAVNANDPILAPPTVEAMTAGGMPANPVVRESSVAQDDRCRGLCGSQQEDLDSLRRFMGKFAEKGVDVNVNAATDDSSGDESGVEARIPME